MLLKFDHQTYLIYKKILKKYMLENKFSKINKLTSEDYNSIFNSLKEKYPYNGNEEIILSILKTSIIN